MNEDSAISTRNLIIQHSIRTAAAWGGSWGLSMMARSTNAPCKGQIQMRKTNALHLFTFGLQRTAGPYIGSITSISPSADDFRSTPMSGPLHARSACLKGASKRLMHCSKQENLSNHLVGALLEGYPDEPRSSAGPLTSENCRAHLTGKQHHQPSDEPRARKVIRLALNQCERSNLPFCHI
jgi:hypothetical protein